MMTKILADFEICISAPWGGGGGGGHESPTSSLKEGTFETRKTFYQFNSKRLFILQISEF